MKPRLVLLYTRNREFDRVLREALCGTEAIIFIARNVGDALQIVSRRGSELDFAVLDLHQGCRGMTLLGGIHTSHREIANPRRHFERFGTCMRGRLCEWRPRVP